MAKKLQIKPPRALKARLRDVARNHDEFDSDRHVIDHFIERGLRVYGAPDSADLAQRLDSVVDDQGYSSRDELIEHLLLRGLRAYEHTETDPVKLEARLRGLGYID